MAFVGGSAPAMANSLMEGYVLPSPSTLKRLTLDELRGLQFEIDKLLRDQRGIIPDQSDNVALQKRNQRIQKLTQARRVLSNFLSLKIKGRV